MGEEEKLQELLVTARELVQEVGLTTREARAVEKFANAARLVGKSGAGPEVRARFLEQLSKAREALKSSQELNANSSETIARALDAVDDVILAAPVGGSLVKEIHFPAGEIAWTANAGGWEAEVGSLTIRAYPAPLKPGWWSWRVIGGPAVPPGGRLNMSTAPTLADAQGEALIAAELLSSYEPVKWIRNPGGPYPGFVVAQAVTPTGWTLVLKVGKGGAIDWYASKAGLEAAPVRGSAADVDYAKAAALAAAGMR